MPYLIALFFLMVSCETTPTEIMYSPAQAAMVQKVNAVRTTGCKCGTKDMPAVGEISWNEKLSQSAKSHADEMYRFNFFSHKSKSGEDAGTRIRKFKYNWAVVGENIAQGQTNFDEVMKDWLKSTSHCKMIMNPHVNEMGIGRSGNYWVQHFGKQKSR